MKSKYYYSDGTVLDYENYSLTLHRVDGPAVERSNGTKIWYKNGKIHRVGGPAIEYSFGIHEWYQNDNLHRLDGPAMV